MKGRKLLGLEKVYCWDGRELTVKQLGWKGVNCWDGGE